MTPDRAASSDAGPSEPRPEGRGLGRADPVASAPGSDAVGTGRGGPGLFTIGHSNHEFDRFAQLLRQHAIEVVADVRSAPYSRYTPQFNREPLTAALEQAGARYVYLGRELGARRQERECYVNGVARYERIAKTPAFLDGLARIRQLAMTQRAALMCAEKDPLTCHRTILVARCFRAGSDAAGRTPTPGAGDGACKVAHILEDGAIETAELADERLMRQFFPDGGDLFRSRAELIEAAYDLQAERLQYVETAADEHVDVMR